MSSKLFFLTGRIFSFIKLSMLGIIGAGEYVVADQKLYKIERQLASRAFFGTSETGDPVVIKSFSDSLSATKSRQSFDLMQRHRDSFQKARFPLTSYCDQHGQIAEYRPGADLEAIMDSVGFTVLQVRDLLRTFVQHIQTLRDMDLVHADIKPANMLIEDGALNYTPENTTLIDFDFLTRANSSDEFAYGSLTFLSPEQCRGRYTSSSDLYGLGVSALTLLTADDFEYYTCIPRLDRVPRGIRLSPAIPFEHRVMHSKLTNAFFRPDAREMIEESVLRKIHGQYERELRAVLDFSFSCTQHEPSARPQTLESCLQMIDDAGNRVAV